MSRIHLGDVGMRWEEKVGHEKSKSDFQERNKEEERGCVIGELVKMRQRLICFKIVRDSVAETTLP